MRLHTDMGICLPHVLQIASDFFASWFSGQCSWGQSYRGLSKLILPSRSAGVTTPSMDDLLPDCDQSLSAQKVAARTAAYERRARVKTPRNDAAAQAHLLAELAPYRGRSVAGYMPIRSEADPLPVMAEMAGHGPVCVPVILGSGRALEFHRWTPGCAMRDGPFGVPIPAQASVVVPEVIIVPLLAFDLHGMRLGYGGGFYDRTLSDLRQSGDVVALGYAFSAQQAPAALPVEATDQRLDRVITERGGAELSFDAPVI